jgi:transcription termination factor NusB
LKREQKILTAHAVALAQDFFHDLRDRHVLINGVLVRTVKQRQARLQRQGVMGFIF